MTSITSKIQTTGIYYTIALLAGLIACKDTSIPREELTETLTSVVCEAYVTCGCKQQIVPDKETCVQINRPKFAGIVADAEILELEFNENCVTSFSQYIQSVGCGEEPGEGFENAYAEFDRCKLLNGRGQAGDDCTILSSDNWTLGDTCRAGYFCSYWGAGCTPIPKNAGDFCDENTGGLCGADLRCLDTDRDGIHTCEVPGDMGQTCNPHDGSNACQKDLVCNAKTLVCETIPQEGGNCEGHGKCQDELVCRNGICRALPKDGELCWKDPYGETTCDEGLVCIWSLVGEDYFCRVPREEGEDCSDNLGDDEICAEGLYCDFNIDNGQYSCISYPKAGEECFSGKCAKGLVCDYQENVGPFCRPLPTEGQPCIGNECADNLGCNQITNTCQPLPAEGQPCLGFDDQCAEGLSCDYSTNTCELENNAFFCSAIGNELSSCIYSNDSICDEPEGTGFCIEGSDCSDCALSNLCPTGGNGICDEPEGTDQCPEGTDPIDCGSNACPFPLPGNGTCDEPEGTDLCPEGTDPIDCSICG